MLHQKQTMQTLTKAEEEIMQAVWQIGPCTVGDIRDYIERELNQEKPPHSTISTMLRILDKKGFLGHRVYGRTFEYFPLITKEEYSRRSLKRLVQDYFGGSANRLVSFLVQDKDLNLAELSKLMDQLGEESEEEENPDISNQ